MRASNVVLLNGAVLLILRAVAAIMADAFLVIIQ